MILVEAVERIGFLGYDNFLGRSEEGGATGLVALINGTADPGYIAILKGGLGSCLLIQY